MKRFLISLISTILAFTAGIITASSWSSDDRRVEPVIVNASPPCPQIAPPLPPEPVQSYSVTPPNEFDFGQNGLKLTPERVKLQSNSVGYEIDVTYPQIIATPNVDPAPIRKINQHLKDSATKLYQWPLDPAIRPTRVEPGVHNTVNFTYQVGLATDSTLSVHFIGYGYNGIAGRPIQDSFAVNYDLTSGKQLKLSDLFKPRSNYLEFISRDCIDAMRSRNLTPNLEGLKPAAENFKSWQITPNGITFNFHACKVANCSEGELSMEISFEELEPMLNPGIPGKFNITYP